MHETADFLRTSLWRANEEKANRETRNKVTTEGILMHPFSGLSPPLPLLVHFDIFTTLQYADKHKLNLSSWSVHVRITVHKSSALFMLSVFATLASGK